jgi:hypothetical protein
VQAVLVEGKNLEKQFEQEFELMKCREEYAEKEHQRAMALEYAKYQKDIELENVKKENLQLETELAKLKLKEPQQ